MKGLSIRAPWWWFILHAGKDIENRDWSTSYRGPLLILASKWWHGLDIMDEAFDVGRMMAGHALYNSPSADDLRTGMRASGGHIVGLVDLVDCVDKSDSPWFVGRYGLKLANPRVVLNPVPFKGALTMVDVPNEIVDQLQFQRMAA